MRDSQDNSYCMNCASWYFGYQWMSCPRCRAAIFEWVPDGELRCTYQECAGRVLMAILGYQGEIGYDEALEKIMPHQKEVDWGEGALGGIGGWAGEREDDSVVHVQRFCTLGPSRGDSVWWGA